MLCSSLTEQSPSNVDDKERERERDRSRERKRERGREASSTSIKSKPVREGQKRSNVGIRFLATLKLVSNSLLRVVLNTLQFS